jgi:hypothetical protein
MPLSVPISRMYTKDTMNTLYTLHTARFGVSERDQCGRNRVAKLRTSSAASIWKRSRRWMDTCTTITSRPSGQDWWRKLSGIGLRSAGRGNPKAASDESRLNTLPTVNQRGYPHSKAQNQTVRQRTIAHLSTIRKIGCPAAVHYNLGFAALFGMRKRIFQ